MNCRSGPPPATPRLSRRRFTALSAALGVGALARSPGELQAAEGFASAGGLGYSLYGMPGMPTHEALEKLHAIGYRAVELCLLEGYDTRPGRLTPGARLRLRQQLEELGMHLPALMENLPLTDPAAAPDQHRDALRNAAELAHDLSGAEPPVIETILGGGDWMQVRSAVADGVATWAEVAEEMDVTVAVKPHRFQAMNHPEHARWLLERVASPRIRIAYDPSHFVLRDFPESEAFAALIPHSVFVHIKDAVEQEGRVQFALPGEAGVEPYRRLAASLDRAGYEGNVCVEVSSQVFRAAGFDAVEAAQQCYDRLAPLWLSNAADP